MKSCDSVLLYGHLKTGFNAANVGLLTFPGTVGRAGWPGGVPIVEALRVLPPALGPNFSVGASGFS
jgi:hypothetical protein